MADGNDSDNESALISVPYYIESLLRESTCTCTERILYPGQIVYGFGSLPKISAKASESNQSSRSKNLVSSRTAKCHKHMVHVLQILSFNIDNERADETTSLKKPK